MGNSSAIFSLQVLLEFQEVIHKVHFIHLGSKCGPHALQDVCDKYSWWKGSMGVRKINRNAYDSFYIQISPWMLPSHVSRATLMH